MRRLDAEFEMLGKPPGRRRDGLPPGPSYRSPFRYLAAIRRDPLGYFLRLHREYGDIVCHRVGRTRSYTIFHPDNIKHVLQDNHQNYVKGFVVARAKPLIGEGLFTSEGSFWRRQRRLAQPAFHRQRISGFVSTMTSETGAMLDRWEGRAGTGVAFNVAAEMSALTLTVVGRTLFSMDLGGEAAEVGRALLAALEYLNERVMTFLPLPVWWPTPYHWRFRRARRALDEVVFSIIERRRRTGEEVGDLLGMLLAARDEETGEAMDDRQLRDELMTFLLAGHETTAVALAWTWFLLATHPEVEERLREEIHGAVGGHTPTIEELSALTYPRMVVEEAMRLYPPVPGIMRQTIGSDTIGGYLIPPDTVVGIFPYVTHRHPVFWDDPERFDPGRFAPERAAARPRFAYLPFSGGPRLCIGNEFALMEATLIVTMLLQRYRLALAPDRPVEPEMRLTLRPRGGIWMTLERRC